MIVLLTGTVVSLDENGVCLDVRGVGYFVLTHGRLLSSLSIGDICTLHTDLRISADEGVMRLFGFSDAMEKRLFLLFTDVQGVGGKVALALFSAFDSATLLSAISLADIALLQRVKGIGSKVASRLVHELAPRLSTLGLAMVATASAHVPNTAFGDALLALENLGYRSMDAKNALAFAQKTLGEGEHAASILIPAALRYFDGR